ncbi:MAG TPA: hypothetical protein VF159_08390 [Gemmatimonadaceae bacterium]
MTVRHRIATTILCGLAASSCGGDGARSKGDSAARGKAVRAAIAPPPAPTDTAKIRRFGLTAGFLPSTLSRDTATIAARVRTASDSAAKLTAAALIKGRTYRDSFSLRAAIRTGLASPEWPVRGAAPSGEPILPFRRIVAFYGNPLSKKMGILGELPKDQMLARFDTVIAQWNAADPTTPVQPALHLIVSVAQGLPGKDGMYRQRSDTGLIEKVYGWAREKHAILFLDIQAGMSTIDSELPRLLPFLERPDVHLAMDPEFYMHYNREGRAPGTKIGSMSARDVNHAVSVLADLVTKYHLPPKILIVHRFTTNMLQGAEQIRLDPRVQVIINMDGWGQPWLKFDTYKACEVDEPVQYTGFKLFFHNDTKKGDALLTPREVLALRPRPIYIQYQ